jgi:hypothetical protein
MQVGRTAFSSSVQLDVFTSTKHLPTLIAAVSEVKSVVKGVVVKAWAEALTDAYNYKNKEGCLAWVNAGGCIWTVGHPDEQTYCASCVARAYSAGAVDKINAVAKAGAC